MASSTIQLRFLTWGRNHPLADTSDKGVANLQPGVSGMEILNLSELAAPLGEGCRLT